MARPAPRLRVVTTPTEDLVAGFKREAALLAELAIVRADIEQARARFGLTEGLMANPRLELLRTRFAPKPEPKA
jgi:hypothetical protein